MRRCTRASLTGLLGVLALPVLLQGQEEGRGSGPKTVEIRMTDFEFRPASITVRAGDTVRFVQTTTTPHNVEFRDTPEGAVFAGEHRADVLSAEAGTLQGPLQRMGPFVLQKGQTYAFVVDPRFFPPGDYGYVCTPHETMGMTGELTVEGSPSSEATAITRSGR